VVLRIAVEPALAKVAELAAARVEPRGEPLDLPFAHVWDPDHTAGELTVDDLGLSGDQVLEAQLAGDRGGEETAGRGGEHTQMAQLPVTRDQLARRRRDDGADALHHEHV